MIIKAVWSITHNHDSEFRTSKTVDPLTGEYKVEAVIKHLTPGLIHDVPDDMGADLIKQGAARLPTDHELDLHELALRGPRN